MLTLEFRGEHTGQRTRCGVDAQWPFVSRVIKSPTLTTNLARAVMSL